MPQPDKAKDFISDQANAKDANNRTQDRKDNT